MYKPSSKLPGVPALLGIIGAALASGGFAVFPWTSTSTVRTLLASLFWLMGLLFWLAAFLMERSGKSQDPKIILDPEASRFVISDQLGRFAIEGRTRAFFLHSQRTQQEEEAGLVQYQEWIRAVGGFLLKALGGAAHNRFNAGRDGDLPQDGGLVNLYDARVQRLQYILDHPEEFPANPEWDEELPPEEQIQLPEPSPKTIDKRDRLRAKLDIAVQKGQSISLLSNEMGFAEDAKAWAKETFNLLDETVGPPESTQFLYAWTPTPGAMDADLGHGHLLRLNFLVGTLDRINTVTILETWQP